MEQPFALHITWTTYGTWLPGDSRGYVGHTLEAPGDWQARENSPGTAYAADHERTRDFARSLQKDTTVRLKLEQARIVALAWTDAATKRGWRIGRGRDHSEPRARRDLQHASRWPGHPANLEGKLASGAFRSTRLAPTVVDGRWERPLQER